MLSSTKNLKELPQVGVTSLHRSVGSAASMRGNIFNMGEEIWYDIPEYEGYYQFSNHYRVRAFYYYTHGKLRPFNQPLIRKITGGLYPQIMVGFQKLGNRKTLYIHHLVAQLFIPNPDPENLTWVLHKDDNKWNYNKENLEWGTPKKNNNDAFYRGLIKKRMGSKNNRSKITEKEALEIFNHEGKGYDLRFKYGVSYTVIHNIKNGYTWNHVTGLPLKRKTKLGL